MLVLVRTLMFECHAGAATYNYEKCIIQRACLSHAHRLEAETYISYRYVRISFALSSYCFLRYDFPADIFIFSEICIEVQVGENA